MKDYYYCEECSTLVLEKEMCRLIYTNLLDDDQFEINYLCKNCLERLQKSKVQSHIVLQINPKRGSKNE